MIKWLMRRLKGTITVDELEKSGKAKQWDEYVVLTANPFFTKGTVISVHNIAEFGTILFVQNQGAYSLLDDVELKKWNG